MGILLVDLAALYEAEIGTGPEPPSSSELGYADYAVWQRALLTGPYRDELVAWWEEALPPDDDGRQPVRTLPADRPRPAVRSHTGGVVPLALEHALAAEVRRLARERGATPFMVLLSAFAVLLARWSGQRDVRVGTPIANRTEPQTEQIVGMFVNTLVLRALVEPGKSFLDLLTAVRETALGAYAHHCPPARLLVGPSSSSSRSSTTGAGCTVEVVARYGSR